MPYKDELKDNVRFRGMFENVPDIEDVEYFLNRSECRVDKVLPTVLNIFRDEIEHLERAIKVKSTRFLERLAEVQSTFRLSDAETHLLSMAVLYKISERFESLCDAVPSGRRNYFNWAVKLQNLTNLKRHELMKATSSESLIRKLGFIDRDGEAKNEIVEFLIGTGKIGLTSSYFKKFEGAAIPLEKLMIAPTDVEAIRTILANRSPKTGVNILLAGPPGTGKTETVHALARELGLSLYEVASMPNTRNDDGDTAGANGMFRMRGLVACRNSIGSYDDGAILIDEADALIGSGRPDGLLGSLFGTFGSTVGKAITNDALDSAVCPQFWVVNSLNGIDPSTRRRFDYAVRYERSTPKDRLMIWETATRKFGLARYLSRDDLERFSREHPVDAGGITSALKNAANLPAEYMTKKEFVRYIEQLLEAQGLFTENRSGTEVVRRRAGEQVDITTLNIEPAADMKRILAVAAKWREDAGANSLNILLQGPPGTGKTHFAHHLAELLGKQLHVKTCSEILSPYVGMTEKTIREIFRQAERENAVLFLDEVDSLLSSRESAVRSWEVTQVNELLSALETFKGVFLAATNHASSLDKASMRRFHFRLRFGELAPAAAELFYRKLLAGFAEDAITPTVRKRLSSMTGLVPSDFANVRRRMTLVPGMTVPHAEMIDGLLEMRNSRSPERRALIGFTSTDGA
ncbi:MAG TPA: AAA family ATPase [Candidatus Ozemobacteraceae bacterium]|nr:AAA family ATPase [Candidatus Ozemobacteraceae bacterium]